MGYDHYLTLLQNACIRYDSNLKSIPSPASRAAYQHELSPDELTEFCQPLQVQSHLEMPGILVQLGHTQRT